MPSPSVSIVDVVVVGGKVLCVVVLDELDVVLDVDEVLVVGTGLVVLELVDVVDDVVVVGPTGQDTSNAHAVPPKGA